MRGTSPLYLRGGFGSIFHSESLPGALPRLQNSPQKVPYGLYTELLSGTSFTVPRAQNRFSWLYRKKPSVCHNPISSTALVTNPGNWSNPVLAKVFPEPYRFNKVSNAPHATDFVDGIFTVSSNSAGAASVYNFNKSSSRVVRNLDAETLIMPQSGSLLVTTELGRLEVSPLELLLIPRGMFFRVHTKASDVCSGYLLENFGANFILPELGPIGASSGLAHARHFEAPEAATEEDERCSVVTKMGGQLFSGEIDHTPFDVVAWYGSLTPLKYDMRLFMPINSVAFDHPDPSIGCLMQSPTAVPGVSGIDVVIFPPRWMVAENTFRPPWFHRNVMSEFMGLIKGEYDAKSSGGFVPGSSSIHNKLIPHGPDAAAVEEGISMNTSEHQRYENTLAFMFESNEVWEPTEYAIRNLKDDDYAKCWQGIRQAFDGKNNVHSEHLPFNPDQQVIF